MSEAAAGDLTVAVDVNTMSVTGQQSKSAYLLGILIDDGTGTYIPARTPFNTYTDDYDPPDDGGGVETG